VIPLNQKNHRHTRPAANTRQTPEKALAVAGLKLRSGYALTAFQASNGILILIDAGFSL
jgi:hypothetical protein